MTLLIAQHSVKFIIHIFFSSHIFNNSRVKKKKNIASTRKLKVKRVYYENSKEIVT